MKRTPMAYRIGPEPRSAPLFVLELVFAAALIVELFFVLWLVSE